MNKTNFSKFWSTIVNSYYVNSRLGLEDENFIFSQLAKTETYKHISHKTHTLHVCNFKLQNGRRVKMIHSRVKPKGSLIPISKSKVLEQIYGGKKKPNHWDLVKKASRNTIEHQILSFREQVDLPVRCPLTNKILTNWGQIHIDHKYPLKNLFLDWMDENELTPEDIKLKGSPNNKVFKDVNQLESWCEYHAKKAQLQPVYSKGNLEKGAKII